MAAIQWLTRTGQMSDEKRQEFILASDVLGLSMLVVQMNHRFDAAATPATVLGPFHIDGSRELGYAGDMADGVEGDPLSSTARCATSTASRSPDAVLDVWQADGDGAYEAQLDVDEARLRASSPPARTAPTACGRSRRRATRSRWTAPVGDLIGSHRDQPLPARPTCTSSSTARLRAAHHAPVPAGRAIPRQRRGLRDEEQLVVAFVRHESATAPDGVDVDGPWSGRLRLRAAARQRRRAGGRG